MLATQPSAILRALRAKKFKTSFSVLVASIVISGSTVQAAETLKQALASAYRSNPALLADRKGVEATDETVSQARAGFRPQVVLSADAGHQDLSTEQTALGGGGITGGSLSDGSTKPHGYTIQISQNVFQGFQTVNALRQAEANVLAARENLRNTEQTILLNGVTAYLDVLRDRALVRLQENNVRVLSREKRATEERFRAGDVSRTDVAQAEARRAGSVSALDLAKSNLRTSEASYQQVVGHMPGVLREPGLPTRNIPVSLPSGISQAQQENPLVVQAAFLELAAQRNVDQLTGQLLPTVNLEADYTDRYDTSAFTSRAATASFVARLNVPLYQGGGVYSQIRQARRTREQLAQQIENQRRIARQNVIAAWSSRRAAFAQLKSDRIQVRANRTALAGVRAEENVGQRSILDVLDAEQELLNAEVALVGTKRNLGVATYNLLNAIGRLTAEDLELHTSIHDPETHYGLVRRKAWGTRTVRDETYSGYVVGDYKDEERKSRHLGEDVIRIAYEAQGWAVTEIRREDNFGSWNGEVVEFEDGTSYK